MDAQDTQSAQPLLVEEPFDIFRNARFGYPMPALAGADDVGAAAAEADVDGAGDAPVEDTGAKTPLADLYDLSSTPEELRPYAEDLLGQVSKNVDAKFREHAEYRKGWAPFEELGLRDMNPQEVSELLQFRNEILGNEDALKEWLGAAAEHVGWQPELSHDDWVALGEANGFFESDEGTEAAEDSGQIDLLPQIQSMLEERLRPIEELVNSQRQEAGVAEVKAQLEQQLQSLEEQHGEYDRAAVVRLAQSFQNEGSEDPIQDAFDEYMRLRGSSQSALLEDKAGQPGVSLGTGQADTSPEKFNGLDDPALKAAARSRIAASR